MVTGMKITCGPIDNQTTITIELPSEKETFGVLVSGGLDSAILYFLIIQENIRLGNLHDIIPLTVSRKEGSVYFAGPVVEHVHRYFNIPLVSHLDVGDNTLYETKQVASGMHEAFALGCKRVYVGVIIQQPEHMIGWSHPKLTESDKFRLPFINADKSHVVDLIRKVNQEWVFHITHSCDHELGRCNVCNGCNERAWGFSQLGAIDPGKV
jgi:hypothetical protein